MCPLSHPWLFTQVTLKSGFPVTEGTGRDLMAVLHSLPTRLVPSRHLHPGAAVLNLRKGPWGRTAKDTVDLLGPSHHIGQGVE